MDIMIFLGVILAGLAIYIGAPDIRQDIGVYLQYNSFILVFGGTIASTMIGTSSKEFKNIIRAFKALIFKKKKLTLEEYVDLMVKVSEKAQSGSKQSLAVVVEGKGDGFMSRALKMVGAGLDKDFINRTLETDIIELRRRHLSLINVVRTMGSFAPMFGMAGTVIGVVQVLKNVTDIDNVVAGMGLALLTTLYGLFFASIVFIPLSNKLRSMSDREVTAKDMVREGVMMIMDKEIPLKVEQYLSAFLGNSQKSDKKKT